MKHYIGLTLLLAQTAACGLILRSNLVKENIDQQSHRQSTIVTFGDPHLLLRGTEQNRESFITTEFINLEQSYLHVKTIDLISYDSVYFDTLPRTTKEIEEKNASRYEPFEMSEEQLYQFSQEGSQLTFSNKENGDPILLFTSEEDSQTYHLAGFNSGEVEVLHYSITPNQDKFSILFQHKSKEGEGVPIKISALFFVKYEETDDKPSRINPKYVYIKGPGYVTKWGGDSMQLSSCGNDGYDLKRGEEGGNSSNLIEDAFIYWIKAILKENDDGAKVGFVGSREFSLRVPEVEYPFSDLNQHCIKILDDVVFVSPRSLGTALVIINPINNEIVASSIFMHLTQFYNYQHSTAERNQELFYTIVHEIGHFLGFGHQFTRTASGKYAYPTSMGYFKSSNFDEQTEYEEEIISLTYQNSQASE